MSWSNRLAHLHNLLARRGSNNAFLYLTEHRLSYQIKNLARAVAQLVSKREKNTACQPIMIATCAGHGVNKPIAELVALTVGPVIFAPQVVLRTDGVYIPASNFRSSSLFLLLSAAIHTCR